MTWARHSGRSKVRYYGANATSVRMAPALNSAHGRNPNNPKRDKSPRHRQSREIAQAIVIFEIGEDTQPKPVDPRVLRRYLPHVQTGRWRHLQGRACQRPKNTRHFPLCCLMRSGWTVTTRFLEKAISYGLTHALRIQARRARLLPWAGTKLRGYGGCPER